MLWIICGLLVALTYGVSPVATRYIMKDGKMSAYPFNAVFQTVTALMLVIIALVLGETGISERMLIAALIGSPLVYIAGLLWTMASHYEEASYVGTVLRFDSVAMAFVGVVFLGEELAPAGLLGGLLIIAAVYAIAKKAKSGDASPTAMKLIIGTIFFGVLWNLAVKLGVGKDTAIMFSAVFFISRAAIAWAVALARKGKETRHFLSEISRNPRYMQAVLVRSVVATSGILALSYGYLTGTFAGMGLISATAPLFSVILGGKVLKESNIKIKLASAAVIVVGAVMLAL